MRGVRSYCRHWPSRNHWAPRQRWGRQAMATICLGSSLWANIRGQGTAYKYLGQAGNANSYRSVNSHNTSARLSAGYFVGIIVFNPPCPVRWAFLAPFYRWENWGFRKANNFLKLTLLVNSRTGIFWIFKRVDLDIHARVTKKKAYSEK